MYSGDEFYDDDVTSGLDVSLDSYHAYLQEEDEDDLDHELHGGAAGSFRAEGCLDCPEEDR